jgi:hypothetical protein
VLFAVSVTRVCFVLATRATFGAVDTLAFVCAVAFPIAAIKWSLARRTG